MLSISSIHQKICDGKLPECRLSGIGLIALNAIEIWVLRTAGAAGIITLMVALVGMWRAAQQISGRETGLSKRMLRTRTYLLVGIPYFLACIFLWKSLPFSFSFNWPTILIVLSGSLLYFSGLMLYLWAWFTLGRNYNVSSAFGVRLSADHRLITDGPYAWVRHPMYLGLQMAAFGGVLLFQTWTLVFLFINFLFLLIRARREEQALTMEYPNHWQSYSVDVPFWFPERPRRR